MVAINKECQDRLESLFKTEIGRAVIQDFKEMIVKADNYPANANDGMLFAMLESRTNGELSVLKQLIKIGERK